MRPAICQDKQIATDNTLCIIKVICAVLANGRPHKPVRVRFIKASVHATVRIILSHEKWPTQADPFPGAAIYAAQTWIVQPPDDRTYSAEVTAFRRNLLHHRIAGIVSLHTLEYLTTYFPFCQAYF